MNLSDGEPLFDIIAGTSSGAMNAAIVISNAVEKGWNQAVKKLNEFWHYVAPATNAEKICAPLGRTTTAINIPAMSSGCHHI